MKKISQFLLLLSIASLFFTNNSFAFQENLDLKAEAAILIDASTGQVLYSKDADKAMYPASTTKIMTLILALEHSDLNEKVTVDSETPFEVEGSHIALEPGEILTMEQLLNALMLESANDAALVIAKHISGSVEEFGTLMTSKASEIGANNTKFVNPNGLPDERHITTAHDLAMIGKYGMENNLFRKFVSKSRDVIPPTNVKEEQRYLNNSNKLLYSERSIDVDGAQVPIKYEGVTGIKTGYTDDAQHCLIASASRSGTEYISVVLKTDKQNLYVDTHKLLNYGFDNFKDQKIASKGDTAGELSWNNGVLKASIGEDIYCKLPPSGDASIESETSLFPELKTPIESGDAIGEISYSYGGKLLASSKIVSTENISEKEPPLDFILKSVFIGILVIILLVLIRIIYVFIRRKKHLNKKTHKKRTSL